MNDNIVTLTNGVRVLNLKNQTVRFDDGTILAAYHGEQAIPRRVRNVNILPKEDLQKHLVEILGEEVVNDGRGVHVTDFFHIPREDDLFELKRTIPDNCLIVVGRTQAMAYGLPFVDTVFAGFDETTGEKQFRNDMFYGSKPV